MRFTMISPALFLLAAGAAFAAPPAVTSTAADAQELSITVYNSGRALVTDRRRMELPAGEVELRFADVAEKIQPETVAFRDLGDKAGVLEQNYEYDLLSPRKLLDKFVGRTVTLLRREERNDSMVDERVEAKLLANNEQPVWQIGGTIVTGTAPDRYEFAELPPNLIARPTLVWLLDAEGTARHAIETSYLTSGIGWKSDYVLTLEAGGGTGALTGWVTIDNQSGAAYPNARLQLIAGDVHQVQDAQAAPMMMKTARMATADAGFAEKAFFEYHLYTLARRATLKENQQKQISLLSASGVTVKKVLRLAGQSWYYLQRYGGGDPQKIEVALELRNDQKNRMGMPLPKGTVRVYQKDTDGSVQFIGEDAIDHTPKDETLDLTIGNAFDVVAERVQTDYRVIGNCVHESAFEITIRNHKAEAVEVQVAEPVGGDWEMVQSSLPHRKKSAFLVAWSVPVAADGETKLTYRVRVRNC